MISIWLKKLSSRKKPARVAIDLIRLGRGGQNGGIKPFVFDFLQWIARERGSEFEFIYFTQSSLVPEVESFRRTCDVNVCVGVSEGCPPPATNPGQNGLIWAPALSGEWRERWPADVLYAPLGLSPYCRPGLPWLNLVADTLHRDIPEMLSVAEAAYRDQWINDALARADAVQCISRFTKHQVERHFRVPPGKLFVTHYAIPWRLRDPVFPDQALSRASRPYFFYPANDWPHKNHLALLEAYARYRAQTGKQAWDLVLSGHFADPGAWEQRIAGLGLTGTCHVLGHTDFGVFVGLFRRAAAWVFPSLYEGFGIPVLEAMAWGVPVACSRAGSLPEVAGSAALYFDANQPGDIERALSQIASDDRQRLRLAATGRKRAETFSMAREAGRLADKFAALARTGTS